jgi:AcrR family transcriptional regulator
VALADNQLKIRAPRQDRSRQTMDRVLKALEALLEEKPFDKITMVELAQLSGTGTSSIYARFKDKRSLILGVHGRLAESVFPCLERLFNGERLAGKPLRKALHANSGFIFRFYRTHGQIVRAALIVDAPFVYERQIKVYHFAADQVSALLGARVQQADRKALDRAIDMGVRLVSSVVHQMLIFQDFEVLRKPVSDRVLVEQLTIAVWALLMDATDGQIAEA